VSKYFGNSVEFWVGIQNEYDIRQEREILENQLKEIHTFEKCVGIKNKLPSGSNFA
jgi:plasmid maintenance system antidote protein VapI